MSADDMSKLSDLAALVTELSRFIGKPPVTVGEIQQHVTAGDVVGWLEDTFWGKISDEQYRALMWLAAQVLISKRDDH